ncbi:MAG: DNA repair protein RecN, partial [Gammaproteobacteria bacterium]
LRLYADGVDIDPEQLSTLEKRLDAYHDAARKHHVQPQELPDHLQSLRIRLDELTSNQDSIEKLKQEQAIALEQYQQAAAELHKSRKKAAGVMAKAITAQLRQLGLPEGNFAVDISRSDSATPQAEGSDQVEYLISLNPGQAMQPLRKVASGGELSRISLAIQIIIRDEEGIPTLIFDEVDAGIGGGIAEIVGKLLKDLSSQHQIFCVTHLPQVASQGDHHIQVRKQAEKNSTFTNVTPLQAQERVEEIARMLGGIKISDKTRAHAREMLGQGDSGI